MRAAVVAGLAVALMGTVGCSDEPVVPRQPASTTAAPTSPSTSSPTSSATGSERPAARRSFDSVRAQRTVRRLAGRIGPRLATSPAFARAGDLVQRRLERLGYAVGRQGFPVPAGDSWGVPVRAGRSFNVVARPPGYDPRRAYAVLGAHLDTVAVAPGAEDNASGIAVLLEVARVTRGRGTRVPVVLVAFGGEEPRGPGALHHFGSRHFVGRMTGVERRHLRAMVALDRVGVGASVPLSTVERTATAVLDELVAAAERLGVPTTVGTDSASDHESFADAGLPAARIGSTPYAAYHSAGDLPAVVRPEQLRRVGRLLLSWLRVR